MAEHAESQSVPPHHVADSRSQRPRAPRPIVVLLAVLGVVVVAYVGALDAPFLWDDIVLLDHPSVAKLLSLRHYLLVPFWDKSGSGEAEVFFYRPLTTLSLALDAACHGRNPSGFHLTNLALHLVNVACVFSLARRMRASVLAAGAAALVWGVLPRLTESVGWVSGRTDELGALGVLTALLAWQRGNLVRLCLACSLAFVGMMGKEMAIAAPLALAVGELWPRSTRRAWLRALIPLGVLAAYVTLRTVVVGQITGPSPVPLGPAERALTVLESVGRYVWMTLDPWHPATQIGVVGGSGTRFVVLGAFAMLASGWLAWRYARRVDGAWAALIVAGAVPVVLVLHIVSLPWVVVAADRLMYLPWAIVCVAGAVGCLHCRLEGSRRHYAAAAVSGLVVSLVLATRARVSVFADEAEFWIDAVETTAAANWGPTRCLNELYARAGLFEESLAIIESLDGREPQRAGPKVSLLRARALGRVGQYTQAYALRREQAPERPNPGEMLDEAIAALHVLDLARAQELADQAHRALPKLERAASVQHSLAEVGRLARLLSDAPPHGIEGEIARARLSTLAGRGPEAETAWTALLERPELPANVADEGFACVAALGSHEALRQAVQRYAARRDARADLVLAANDRLALGDRLKREWPRVLRALERLRGAPLAEVRGAGLSTTVPPPVVSPSTPASPGTESDLPAWDRSAGAGFATAGRAAGSVSPRPTDRPR